jgi:hypothetical protein
VRWPEPPRAARAESLLPLHGRRPARPPDGAAPSDTITPALPETAWTGSGPDWHPWEQPQAALSPGLAQLVNAALIDSAFCAAFLASPVAAAQRARRAPAQTFGTTLPDPELQLGPVRMTEADLALLGCMAPPSTLSVAARTLLDLSRVPAELTAPASQEGALADAA